MKALILAAGLGTRLRPLTDSRPKALVTIDGQTLLDITIGRLVAAGADDIVVNVHHFGEQIIEHIATHHYPVSVKVSDERTHLLDTGGGLRRAAALFAPTPDPILIHNVDILHNADLRAFYAAGATADALLLVSRRETSRYLLFDKTGRLVGWTNIKTGAVRSPHPSLRPECCQRYAFSGIHCVSPRLIDDMAGWPEAFPVMDFYLDACARRDVRAFPVEGLRLLDVGKTASLAAAHDFLLGADLSAQP